jgi:DNA topoisomerase-1
VQRGELIDETKPPRQSIPKEWHPAEVDLEQALRLLSLPRQIGAHPEDGIMIWANIGRFGPYLKHAESTSERGGTNANLQTIEEVFTVGMNHAVQLLAEKVASRGGRGITAKPIHELGEHPDKGGPVDVMNGKYGPYVKWAKVNATIPKEIDPGTVNLEKALELLEARMSKPGKKGKKDNTTKKQKKLISYH